MQPQQPNNQPQPVPIQSAPISQPIQPVQPMLYGQPQPMMAQNIMVAQNSGNGASTTGLVMGILAISCSVGCSLSSLSFSDTLEPHKEARPVLVEDKVWLVWFSDTSHSQGILSHSFSLDRLVLVPRFESSVVDTLNNTDNKFGSCSRRSLLRSRLQCLYKLESTTSPLLHNQGQRCQGNLKE